MSTGAAGLAGGLHPLGCVGCLGQGQSCNLQSGEWENLLGMESGWVLRKKEKEELDKEVTRSVRLRKEWLGTTRNGRARGLRKHGAKGH